MRGHGFGAACLVPALLGCAPAPEQPLDGTPLLDADDHEESAIDEAVSDGSEAAAEGGAGGGPLTNAVATMELTVDRLCDLDGDGVGDNAVADLGLPHSQLLAVAVSTAVQGTIETGQKRIFHFPWVDDLDGPTDPETILLFFAGEDTEEPDDVSDDLSGEEEYYVPPHHLDACGEPRTVFRDVVLENGTMSGTTEELSLLDELSVVDARAEGTFAPGGMSAELTVCGVAPIRGLGSASNVSWLEGITLLEGLLAGGSIFGMPSLPGLTPDLDLDGDGIERIELDAEGHVASCIDGDLTVIAGTDCWADERIADGYSFNLRLTTVGAVFLGRQPDWRDVVEGTCEGGPPETSLFDPQ